MIPACFVTCEFLHESCLRILCLTVFDAASSLGLVQMYFDELRQRLAEAAPAREPEVAPVLAANFESELDRNLAALFRRG